MLTDLTAVTEPVLSKKNLFEGGDAWNQNVASVTPSKVSGKVLLVTHLMLNNVFLRHVKSFTRNVMQSDRMRMV